MSLDVALRRTLPGFTLDVAFASAGGLVSLFGRSGSGKSMTLGLIAGLARPDAGHVRIGDSVLLDTARGRNLPVQHRRIGLVFQDAQLFPHLSVRQNLLFGRWFAGVSAGGIAFDHVVEALGIGGLLPRRPGKLSGGEKQRVAIGRALLADPRLLLFDEPLAALDRQRRLEILPLIERLRDEFAVPIVYVSHAMEEVVRLGGHVVVLEAGRVVAAGPPEAVLGAARLEDRRFGRATIVTTIAGAWDEAFDLTALDHSAGTLWLAGRAGPPGHVVRALVRATDVSLAPGDPGPISIRSALVGRIAAVEPEGALAAVTVDLRGGGQVVALVTRRALHDLALAVGSPVRALVKAVALDEGAIAQGAFES